MCQLGLISTEGVNPYIDNSELIIQFWRETVQPSEFALDIIENGYKILFKETSLPYKFDNRSFAIKNRPFVEEEIKKLLSNSCREELDKPAPFCNPYTFPGNSQGSYV